VHYLFRRWYRWDEWSVLPEPTSPRDYRGSSLVDLTGWPARRGVGPHVMGDCHAVADKQPTSEMPLPAAGRSTRDPTPGGAGGT
jgi:hypothetical protein